MDSLPVRKQEQFIIELANQINREIIKYAVDHEEFSSQLLASIIGGAMVGGTIISPILGSIIGGAIGGVISHLKSKRGEDNE